MEAAIPKRILIVDDEEDIASGTTEMLRRAGYDAAFTINGDEALTMIASFRPDLVILDINMPNVNGGYIAARLAENPDTVQIPVIMLSALVSRPEEYFENRGNNKRYMMSKPASREDLIKRIESMLSD